MRVLVAYSAHYSTVIDASLGANSSSGRIMMTASRLDGLTDT